MGAGYLPRLALVLVVLTGSVSGAAKPPRGPGKAKPQTQTAEPAPGKAKPQPQTPEPGASAPAPKDAPEKGVQGQQKSSGASPLNAVQTEESKEGVKTYKFGAVEVESRLKSPELIYFMRRVRAEFAAGELGHRSFLPELHSTERLPTFR
jgi:hypothetical protein